jgi:hypothetical protein
MGAVRSSETLKRLFTQTRLRDAIYRKLSSLHTRRGEDLKSHYVVGLFLCEAEQTEEIVLR